MRRRKANPDNPLEQKAQVRAGLLLAGACLVVSPTLTSSPAHAQMRPGWNNQIDGLTVYQGSTGLSGGGEFSSDRQFFRGASLYNLGDIGSVGFSASFGRFGYDFSDLNNQPWGTIRDTRVSIPMRLRGGENSTFFIIPQVRWDYEDGASASDGQTYGVFAGVAWDIGNDLTIGPAFGAYSQIEESGADVFPALLIDWDITSRWSLSTGTGLGATGGPGLTLGYALNDASTISLAARSESVRFRLSDSAIAPDGVGEDSSIPVVVTYEYAPNPGFSFAAFAGAEFEGELSLDDASGTTISRQSYDTAPLVGLAARLRF